MDSKIVFWIVCGCLIFSLCESLWRSFRAIRKSETKQDVNDYWCDMINSIIVYTSFFALYVTESFGYIYNSISDYIYWELEWEYFVWSEGAFLLAIILIWMAVSLPAFVLKVITSPGRAKEVIKDECYGFYTLALIPLAIGYIYLIDAGSMWALIPFFLGLIPLVSSIIDANNKFRYLITWRMMLWTSIQAILVIGIGMIAIDLMNCCQLSYAMGLYEFSYAANLISIVIIGSLVLELLVAADRYFKPKMYIPMSPSNIEEWKEKHQAELMDAPDDKNDSNTANEVKDE